MQAHCTITQLNRFKHTNKTLIDLNPIISLIFAFDKLQYDNILMFENFVKIIARNVSEMKIFVNFYLTKIDETVYKEAEI